MVKDNKEGNIAKETFILCYWEGKLTYHDGKQYGGFSNIKKRPKYIEELFMALNRYVINLSTH
jgi:hypothetical protein